MTNAFGDRVCDICAARKSIVKRYRNGVCLELCADCDYNDEFPGIPLPITTSISPGYQ